jgi:hypothetical protein
MKSKRRPIEIFTEICRVKGDAEGYVLCRKAFDCCAISIADIPLASNRLVLHVRCQMRSCSVCWFQQQAK